MTRRRPNHSDADPDADAERDDQLARAAARRMLDDPSLTARHAVRLAIEDQPKFIEAHPRDALVLRHLAALRESVHGAAGEAARRRAILESIVEFLEFVEWRFEPDAIAIAGPVASGHLDGPVRAWARASGLPRMREVAEIVEIEAGAIVASFDAIDGRFGRLERTRFTLSVRGFEDAPVEVVLARLPTRAATLDPHDLRKGRATAVVTLDVLRARLDGR